MAVETKPRDLVFEDVRELVRLARRCVSPFEGDSKDEMTYTQREALQDLEAWFNQRPTPATGRS
jgi:hypothetical protein